MKINGDGSWELSIWDLPMDINVGDTFMYKDGELIKIGKEDNNERN